MTGREGGSCCCIAMRTGGRVGEAMDTLIEELPEGQLDNAETVVLEYGDPADAQRCDVTKYDLK